MNEKIEIKDIASGMGSVNTDGRVFNISSIVEFKRSNGTAGKVVNLSIGDYTGFVKLVLWDNEVGLVEDDVVKLGDVVQIKNGMVKESMYGGLEVSVGKYGSVETIDDNGSLPTTDELNKSFIKNESERAFIKNLTLGDFEISGNVVDVFKTNFMFNTCSTCGAVVRDGKCVEHGETETKPQLVINTLLDDTSGDIRAIFFRDVAEKLCGINAVQLSKLGRDKRFSEISNSILGRHLVLTGKVKKNKMFDRVEVMVNDFKDLNSLDESKKVIDNIELKVGGFDG